MRVGWRSSLACFLKRVDRVSEHSFLKEEITEGQQHESEIKNVISKIPSRSPGLEPAHWSIKEECNSSTTGDISLGGGFGCLGLGGFGGRGWFPIDTWQGLLNASR